ncbi:hypothetical protein ACMFMG_001019 [Clarireedia jacksonii]
MPLSLELNAQSVSAAVGWYVQDKVDKLARRKKEVKKYKKAIESHLLENANGTFLWVALVCQNLEKSQLFRISKLQDFPPELDPLYGRMIQQIIDMEDIEARKLCLKILAIAVIVYRPVTLDELVPLIGLDNDDEVPLEDMIQHCGSFLAIRGRSVFFVHQSAKDFLYLKAAGTIFPNGIERVHNEIFQNSITVMSKTLRRDIYDLRYPGLTVDQIKQPNPDPLTCIRYSSIYWVDHLRDGNPEQNGKHIQNNRVIYEFLKEHLLHWLEVTSLMRNISKIIIAIRSLESYTPISLFFAPEESIIRKIFQKSIPRWISKISRTQSNWSTALQTLEGHSNPVSSVAFSPDNKIIASGSWDCTIRLWDTVTGELQQILEGYSDSVNSVAFSPDSRIVASGSWDNTIRLWDTATGELQQTLKGHSDSVTSVVFSPNSRIVVSGSDDCTIRLWDTATGELQQTLKSHLSLVKSVAFSPDSRIVASGSADTTIRLWNIVTGELQQILEGHSSSVNSVTFSPDNRIVASGSNDNTIRLWDTAISELQQIFKDHSDSVRSVAFSPNSRIVASGSADTTIRLWNIVTGELQQILEGHSSSVNSVTFSPNSKIIASGSDDRTIRLWDTATGELQQTLKGHLYLIDSVAFSPDSRIVASGSRDNTIRLWDTATGELQQILEGHSSLVSSVAFSPDSRIVASGSWDQTIRLWDTATGELQQTLKGDSDSVTSVAFSPDIRIVASGSWDETIRLWDIASGELQQTFKSEFLGASSAFDLYFILNNWIVERVGEEILNILWLPPDYRPSRWSSVSIYKGTTAMGLSSGDVFLFRLEDGSHVL